MNITIIGSGYVGLVTGVCLSDAGHKVICVDKDKNKINILSKGQIPIYEPGLEITSNFLVGFFSDIISSILSQVPTGTVDLIIIILSS